MDNITCLQLAELIEKKVPLQLIDVRESSEHRQFNIGGLHIPLNEIVLQMDKVEKEIPVVLYCRRGIRSQIAIQRLQAKYPYRNLKNLTGGTAAWENYFNANPNN